MNKEPRTTLGVWQAITKISNDNNDKINNKNQIPNPKQIKSSKFQIQNKSQIINSKSF